MCEHGAGSMMLKREALGFPHHRNKSTRQWLPLFHFNYPYTWYLEKTWCKLWLAHARTHWHCGMPAILYPYWPTKWTSWTGQIRVWHPWVTLALSFPHARQADWDLALTSFGKEHICPLCLWYFSITILLSPLVTDAVSSVLEQITPL